LEVTGESVKTQYIVWPLSSKLDPIVSTLMNRWILKSIVNGTIDELYSTYFMKPLCPIGTAGDSCQLPCDRKHGTANSKGVCICSSPKWGGDDCARETPEEKHIISNWVLITAYTLLGINITLIAICAGWLFWKRKNIKVKFSQPVFLALVLSGCLISSFTIPALVYSGSTGTGADSYCMAIPWLYSVGFSITFGSLFAKINQVYVLFKSSEKLKQVTVSTNETLRMIFMILIVDISILIIWIVLDPLKWSRFTIRDTQYGELLESVGYCTSNSWRIFVRITGSYHLILLTVASILCYVSRAVPTAFSEGKYISMAMFSNFQIFIIFLPIFILLGQSNDPTTMTFVQVIVIWMNDFLVVMLIFGNLMHRVHWDKKEEKSATQELRKALEEYNVKRSNRQQSFPSQGK